MTIYLMRHGQAIQGADDSKRPLSESGRREVADVARFLLQRKTHVDIFYHSTKQRAQETAEIVRNILNPKVPMETKSGLAPNDAVPPIAEDMSQWRQDVMVVSHLPFLGKLVTYLVSGKEDDAVAMPTASVVILKKEAQSWIIQEVIYPEQLLK
jgi:phosphohistidine phosphatase